MQSSVLQTATKKISRQSMRAARQLVITRCAYLPVCLPACRICSMHACLPVCLPACLPACLQDEDEDDFDSDGFKAELSLLIASAGKGLDEIADMNDEDKVKHADVIYKDKTISAGKVKAFVDKWAGQEAAEEITTKKARIAWCLEKLMELV